MEANGSLRGYHTEVRDEDMNHSAIRRAASSELKQIEKGGALENAESDPRQRVEQTFPNKLHYMLDHGLEESERDVIAWQPHGRAFLVLDQRRFVGELLPNWFRQNKYQSFQRQLNSYGFQRITQGRDKGAYYHMSFVKGRRELCQHIKRVKIKGNGGRKPSNPETEPNFYLFPPIPPPPPMESGTTNPAKGAEPAAGSARVDGGGLASLLPPGPADLSDRPLAQLLSMGAPIQNPYPLGSGHSYGGGAKAPVQDLSLLSFLSSAKNNAQISQSGGVVGSTPAHHISSAAAALSGAPYILTSTMGTSPPAPAFAPAFDAAASQSLQQSLLLQYSRRMEAEAHQARERNAILAMLLNASLPGPAPAASPPRGAASARGMLQRASAATATVPAAVEAAQPPPTASSLLRLLTQEYQQQQEQQQQQHQQQQPQQQQQQPLGSQDADPTRRPRQVERGE